MAPIAVKLKDRLGEEAKVCITSQHKEMLQQVISSFDLEPDFDLNVMKHDQTLSDVVSEIIFRMQDVFSSFRPDVVLIHGDTSTSLAGALSAFYHKIPIAHIEAGLRSGDLYMPWPEEANRKLIAAIANLHFAPTEISARNLIKEGVAKENIFIVGNSVIDALKAIQFQVENDKNFKSRLDERFFYLDPAKRTVLVTIHRRESFGEEFKEICWALKQLAKRSDINIVYPVHLNPRVHDLANNMLKNEKNIFLIEPLDYISFVYLMIRCYFILTDSCGIQEEAPTLGKPVLLIRDNTERPEAVAAGVVKIIGRDARNIIKNALLLMDNKEEYEKMAKICFPYGDGNSSSLIIEHLANYFKVYN
ncbi:MAG: UDP-N-acetylglucosamine 2-epimerase (non-hydrolyzing) [Gammaproteobacteria bacterium]